MKLQWSLRIGWESVRANAVPVVILWGAALLVSIAYYQSVSVAGVLKVFGDWQVEYGKLASVVNRIVFGGLIPGVFLLAQPQRRPRRPALSVVVLSLWSGVMSVPQDWWFCFLEQMFGGERTAAVLFKKTLIDQTFWAMLVITPLNSVFFPWWGNDLSWRGTWRGNWRRLFARYYVVNLLTNWAVWIPVVIVVYSFPLELQMTVSSFTCSIWALACCWLGGWKESD